MSYDLSKNLLKLWWIRRSLLISFIVSISLALVIYLSGYNDKLLIGITILILSLETLVSMRSILHKFYEVLNIIGAPRRIITIMITLNTSLSMVPLYVISVLTPPSPVFLILIVFINVLLNYLLARRKLL
ncbi:MAG: hypothetical protein ACP5GI_03315 [Sulfolobales archaeon]